MRIELSKNKDAIIIYEDVGSKSCGESRCEWEKLASIPIDSVLTILEKAGYIAQFAKVRHVL
jgi:hypothetical protein